MIGRDEVRIGLTVQVVDLIEHLLDHYSTLLYT